MTHSQPKPFKCPNCGADYKVVRVEAAVSDAFHEITCKSCGGPLQGREGRESAGNSWDGKRSHFETAIVNLRESQVAAQMTVN